MAPYPQANCLTFPFAIRSIESIKMADQEEEDLNRLTVNQLKDRLRNKGLPISGKKSTLIERLQHSEQPQQNSNDATNATFKEPKIKWKKSKAKSLLYKDIKEGRVPLEAKDENGKTQMDLKDIYAMHPEYKEYDYSKFSSRVSSLRKTIKELKDRAAVDLELFNNFKANHPPSLFSHKGYEQWQGSRAQIRLLKDIEAKKHITLGKKELWSSHEDYYENFPLHVFRDKLYQEIRTAKYLHTIDVKGRDPRKKAELNKKLSELVP